jgi:hypothetical protein
MRANFVLAPAILLLLVLAFTPAVKAKVEGGELGNAFVPFDSRIGHYSLEYDKDWHINDLSVTTSFAEARPASGAASFFEVSLGGSGARSLAELSVRLMTARPGVAWSEVTVGGLTGFEATEKGVREIHLLRAAGDELTIRLRSSDGERSDEILSHMLGSFRPE